MIDPAVRRAVLALGSNQGDRVAQLQRAVDVIAAWPGLRVHGVSSVYETDPVGGPQQPDYLNAVLVVETTESPETLLRRAHEVEHEQGRVRRERWGPRTLDVDIVVVGDLVVDSPGLTLPHPRAHERAFVLLPWVEVEPGAAIPAVGAVREILDDMQPSGNVSGVRRRDDLALRMPA